MIIEVQTSQVGMSDPSCIDTRHCVEKFARQNAQTHGHRSANAVERVARCLHALACTFFPTVIA
jgi:hypothetical protein